MIPIVKYKENVKQKELCEEFIHSNRPKYVLGTNEFAKSIAENVEIDGFIDDFTNESTFMNKPIIKLEKLLDNSIVAIAVVYGRPLTAIKRVKEFNIEYIDYFSLLRYSQLPLKKILFLDGFENDFYSNLNKYQSIYNILADEESKVQFSNLINFRLSYDLKFMNTFKNIQDKQYFEDFLYFYNELIFADVGGFDGLTTLTFIKNYPNYKSIYFFEPEESNLLRAKNILKDYKNIFYYKIGLSDRKEVVKFSSEGSSSNINECGNIIIETDILDNIVKEPLSYIKMDVEGWESKVIEGAKNTIKEYKPTLAVCVYHKYNDFWAIPEQILSIRDDYKIFLRHYTEGITETVMYFV